MYSGDAEPQKEHGLVGIAQLKLWDPPASPTTLEWHVKDNLKRCMLFLSNGLRNSVPHSKDPIHRAAVASSQHSLPQNNFYGPDIF